MTTQGSQRVAGPDTLTRVRALLLDLDGVLYVEERPIAGATAAVASLRKRGLELRFVTNTTAHSREQTLEKLRRLGFSTQERELVTPAALALARCRERGHTRVALIMNEQVKRDFAELEEASDRAHAVIIGDLGEAFDYHVLNQAFRQVIAGAELIAPQKNRYWMRADGLSLDVGPFVARSSSPRMSMRTWWASPPARSSRTCSPTSAWTPARPR